MNLNISYPDEEAGELPLAYVVKREGTDLSEKEVMSFVSKMVRHCLQLLIESLIVLPMFTDMCNLVAPR